MCLGSVGKVGVLIITIDFSWPSLVYTLASLNQSTPSQQNPPMPMTSISRGPLLVLDHIILATLHLEATAAQLEADWGTTFSGGGQHLGFGTHNKVMRLDASADHAQDGGENTSRLLYLELIAPDPSQPTPAQPRLFDLDNPELQDRFSEKPRLIHYAARCSNMPWALAQCGYNPGVPTAMSRGTLSWTITLPPNRKPASPVLPTLIEWPDMDAHPAVAMPASGVSMPFFSVAAPPEILAIIRATGLQIIPAASPATLMRAELATPNGLRVFGN